MPTAWDRYLEDHLDDAGRHKDHPEWAVAGVWEFERSDGLMTAHKMESPWPSWRETVEWSMRLADAKLPLGADLPDGMRSREDPLYGPLED